jgi:ribosome-binding protein aMBF1 (putative translation factor)
MIFVCGNQNRAIKTADIKVPCVSTTIQKDVMKSSKPEVVTSINNRLFEIRKAKELTQVEFADRIKISRSMLGSIDESLVKIIQIEHINGVNEIDDILKVPNLDSVVIGPYDLSEAGQI